jgi:hypothetical protein
MGIIAALCIALLISLIFSFGNGRGSSIGAFLIFFFVLFLAVLAGHFWITPFGPVLWGIAWLPLLFIGIIFAFLLMIPPPYTSKSANAKAEEAVSAVAAISTFMWLLLIILLVAVIAGYYK